MLIYLWNTETKEYLKYQEAQKNPKRPGEYLMPANSTTEQIPDVSENQTIIYNGEHWEIIPDFRGKYMVNSEMFPVEVTKFGDLPEGYVLIAPEQIELLRQKGQNYFVISDNKLIKNPNYEQEEKEKEQKRIAKLNMTKYDFFKLVCLPNGISYQKLMELVNSNDDTAAAWNLCSAVYRGDELLINSIKTYLPDISDDELTKIFEKAVSDV